MLKIEKERGKLEQGIKRLAYVYAQKHMSQEEYDQEVEGMEKRLKVIMEREEEMVNENELKRKLDFPIRNVKILPLKLNQNLNKSDWKTKFNITREIVEHTKIDNDDVRIMLRFQGTASDMQRKNLQHHIGIPYHFNLYRLES